MTRGSAGVSALLTRWRAYRAGRRADRVAAATAELRLALADWAEDDAARAELVAALVDEQGGLWLREAASGRLKRWFYVTDYEGMSDLQVAVDLDGARRALCRGRIPGEPAELAALARIVG
ncbi:hypothetical protein [Parafrankia sp. EUN1f]|uniref:hypothetical protein n=1 Tax=Parafrankia sp. EUN1f TaxID=102897 RepID=UPI0001C4535A|nr:hypothetical protein [Parafrankia sp. EUN1f]EFC78897.1 hypothetical protein FrEUN1fDRAFT_7979 [Parafrankia sp. EUN1f]